ncbi:hypothetical protein HDU67_003311 [Dinochytrium kinnereticum]|nr:hypothetical protein HDU67_003311 [Dinochytrium kinnereticum]
MVAEDQMESAALDQRSKSLRTASFNSTVPKFAAKVYAPLLNGGSIGVFATRSPHHPNPFGLSLVKIESIDKTSRRIYISGLDMCEGTPILDLKPWNPADCPKCFHKLIDHGECLSGGTICENTTEDSRCQGHFDIRVPDWVNAGVTHAYQLPVHFEEKARASLLANLDNGCLRFYKSVDRKELEQAIVKILSLDIRSFHQGRGRKSLPDSDLVCDSKQFYELDFDTLNIKFVVTNDLEIQVTEVTLRDESI